MKFSENWLRSHVPTTATRDELLTTLTAIGLEVEDVTILGEQLQKIVVAKIVNCAPHPQADRLQICQVDAGDTELVQIVCGAPNARAGLLAPLALAGAKVGDMQIKAAELRGVASQGMLCSAKELGLDEDASGLMELPADAPIGQALASYLGLPDASIEIKLTPNRSDCFSVRGIAYDVATACGSEVAPFNISAIPAVSQAQLEVKLEAAEQAPRYYGRVIEGLNPKAKTPIWMAERLHHSGIRPISLLVDITQYVMLEIGQPMHAYDRDTLKGPIAVRTSHTGEKVKLLDGKEVTLEKDILTITDADQVIALAGIMGGDSTRVTDTTSSIFLEAAHFSPAAIMGKARKFGLHTEASHRFERGVDPELPAQAIELASKLVLELAGGTPGPALESVLPQHLPKAASILLRRKRVTRLLGIEIAEAEIERILNALGMQVHPQLPEGWQVDVPTRRFDIVAEEDLIEELARIYGYDRIPTTLPGGAVRIAISTASRLDEASARRQLVARDMLETINYAFVDKQLLQNWQLNTALVALANPLSAELAVMRPQLLPGLVETLGRNLARQAGRVRLFELGKVFTDVPGKAPLETLRIAAAVCGASNAEQWGQAAAKVSFHDLKGDLESLAAASGAVLEYRRSTLSYGHPGRSADIYRNGERIGWIGQLHPRLQKTLELDSDVIAFELDIEPLLIRATPRAQTISAFPSVRRDLAFVMPETITWASVAETIRQQAGEQLRDLLLFDLYSGQGVEPGYKSLAMGLILQENSRTLTDNEVDILIQQVITAIEQKHSARIRS